MRRRTFHSWSPGSPRSAAVTEAWRAFHRGAFPSWAASETSIESTSPPALLADDRPTLLSAAIREAVLETDAVYQSLDP